MNKLFILIFLNFTTSYAFSQTTVAELCEQLSESKHIIRQSLDVTMSFVKLDTSQRNRYIHESEIVIGEHTCHYKVISEKEGETAKAEKIILEFDQQEYHLDSVFDEITGQQLPSGFIYDNLRAYHIEFYKKHFLCLIGVTSTFSSFSLSQNVYLFDLNKENTNLYTFILRFGYEHSFGDFNNDGVLDVYKWMPKSESCQDDMDINSIRECLEIKAYTLKDKGFIPLEHEKHYVLVKVMKDFSMKVFENNWF